MNHDEIRDRLGGFQVRTNIYQYLGQYKEAEYLGDACGLIETLLAREAEVLDLAWRTSFQSNPQAYMDMPDKIRAILYPQPAALAEENDNGN